MKFFLLLSLFVFCGQTFAGVNSSVNLIDDIQKEKMNLEKQEIKQRKILATLFTINKQIKKTVTERSNLNQEKLLLEANIRNLSEKVVDLDKTSKIQKAQLSERLKAIYQLGGQSLARLFIGSATSTQFERNLKIMGVIAENDLDLIRNYSRDMQELKNKKEKLNNRLAYLKKIEEKISNQEAKFTNELLAKNKILNGIRKNKNFTLNKLNQLKEQSAQYNIDDSGVFDTLFKASFADQKGLLPIPVAGRLSKRFGLEKFSEHTYNINHKGIFIAAMSNASVQSVFDGRVSFAGQLPGYGNTLVIDHGDHYYTVYAHVNEVKVQVGDNVQQSQVIASVGRSSTNDQDGLYFEVRHFSEPYDPQQWMKGFNL